MTSPKQRTRDDCPGERHNTLAAARGINSSSKIKCICPLAVELEREYRSREVERAQHRRLKSQGVDPRPRGPLPSYLVNVRTGGASSRQPDLLGAPCTTLEGRAAHDEAYARNSVRALQQAKSVCESCPARIRNACFQWVIDKEDPAGSWGGIWAGMTGRERKRFRDEQR